MKVIFLTHQEKLELEKYKNEIKQLKKNNEIKYIENKILAKQIKDNEQIICDLHKRDFKVKYETTTNILKNLIKVDKEKDLEIDYLKKKVISLESKLAMQSVITQKNSSNSSKPSSTNAFKKIITNRREKSSKNLGGQEGHTGVNLVPPNIEDIINEKDTIVDFLEINKTSENKDMVPVIRTIIDIKIIKKVTVVKIYPDLTGKYDIPKEYATFVKYGPTLKSMCVELLIASNNSTDAVKTFVSSITNSKIDLSKGTLINWLKAATSLLSPQIVNIQEKLMCSYYLNNDESQIKINGEAFNVICASNKEYTRLWISKNKSKKAIDNIDFLPHYNGKIVKDGTNLYDSYGDGNLSQCVSHVSRYIKGVSDFNDHKGALDMAKFLSDSIYERTEAIDKGMQKFSDDEYNSYLNRFSNIVKSWKKEWMSSCYNDNPVYDSERRLLQRFEDNKERNEILYFLKDFKVPATNNQAESDLRPIKIKQKIGKFRNENGANYYATIRSCINTYKKQSYNSFEMLIKAFSNDLLII